MDPVVVGIVVGVAACVAALVALGIRSYWKRKRGLARLSEALGGLIPDQLHHAEEGGVKYAFAYHAAKHRQPAFLVVQVRCPSETAFRVKKQSWFDRLGQVVGLAFKLTTPDPEFDRRFQITTEDPTSVQALFELEPTRRAVREIFDFGFREIQLRNETLTARWTPFDPSEERDPAMIRDTGLRLAFLARDVWPERSAPLPEGVWLRRGYWALVALLFVTGAALFVVDRHPVLDVSSAFAYSLSYSLPALGGFLILAYWAFRGRTTSHTEYGVLVLPALIAFPLAGHAGVVLVNGLFDSGPSTPHRELIVEKTTRHTGGKSRRTVYEIRVRSWRPGEGLRTFEISSSEHHRVRVNQSQVTFHTKPGLLGFEWIESRQLEFLAPGAAMPPRRPPRERQEFISLPFDSI